MAALSVNERAELDRLFISLEYARKPFLLRLLSHFSTKITSLLKRKNHQKVAKNKSFCSLHSKIMKKAS